MRAYGAVLAVAVALLLVGLAGVQRAPAWVYEEQAQVSTMAGELVAGATVGQTFVARYGGLQRVEMRLAGCEPHQSGPLIFHLRPSPHAADDLVTLHLDMADVHGDGYFAFGFPPLRGSAGQRLYFYLEAPQSTAGHAIGVWGVTQDTYADGEAVLEGLGQSGVRDLAFRLSYDPSPSERIGVALDRLAANKPLAWGDRRLYVVLAAAHLALLCALLIRLLTSEERDLR